MALPVTIPNEFANATASIPLSQLDTNFTTLANAVNGISDGSESLANVSVTGGTISNVAVSATTLNTSGAVVFNDAGADVDFRVESDTDANAFFLDGASGNIGMGTGSPTVISGYTILTVNNATNGSGAYFQKTGTTLGRCIAESGNFTVGAIGSGGNLIFESSGTTERMRITSAGAVEIANGNLKFTTNGTGIDFSASAGGGATSSLLDDYEEGTWTPTLSSSGTPPTVSVYQERLGKYTKIGNMVTVVCQIRATITAAGTGSAYVTGLPISEPSGFLSGIALGLRSMLDNENPSFSYLSGSVVAFNSTFDVAAEVYLTFSVSYQV